MPIFFSNRYLHIIAIILFFLSINTCSNTSILSEKESTYLENNPDLTVGIYISYPPYEFLNNKGQVDGILLDYLKKLESNISHTFKKKYYREWQLLIDDAKQNKVDIILNIQNTEERRTYLTFTEPVFKGKHIILTKNDKKLSIKDLKNKKVAVGSKYSIEEYLSKKYPEIILTPRIDEKACIKALINNEVDAYIGLETISLHIIAKEGYTGLKKQSTLKYNNELSFASSKDKPILASIIKKGNNSINLEEKNEIINKWLYDINVPFHKKPDFWNIALKVLVLILILFLFFIYYLKQEVKRRTKALFKAKLIAEKNNQLKTLFLQNISHEIKTPLNIITGFSNLLKYNSLSKESKAEYLNNIIQESTNLTSILNDIIEISELKSQKIEPKNKIINIYKEVNSLYEIYKPKALHKNLSFEFQNLITSDKSYIITDKHRLIKAISKILDNAIKFTDKGHISFISTIQNNELLITINDTGIGINPEKINAIFSEFYQEERKLSKKYDGLGVGLSIANKNIKSLGGHITIDSTPNEGCKFSINLPLEISTSPIKDTLVTKPLNNNDSLKIIIAEDMKLNYLVLHKMLDKLIAQENHISWAQNGLEAIKLVEQSSYDIIFMDIKMPIVDGYEATKKIKKIDPNICIIAQTAYNHEEAINKASIAGFDGYLTKPIDSGILKVVLQQDLQINVLD
ncbi:hypothetical protein A8C32_17405 [Flavivirga aquatica]|uniref:histidine kinase n=1 Tax=Flavivirga aquatica TaxID=1849968 RepID=A0A1E5T873_9FLAO|nr:transporter substrate-binding domain-containing protein [Flavivirga aquatica]OEK07574.1 hypothetical protein A8C32_17405 [Flavivirga aquatica]